MTVGVLRSCYSRACRFYKDGPLSEIRYYFSAPGAQHLPIPTIFCGQVANKGNYENAEGTGEISTEPHPWRDGRLPAGPDGLHFHGSQSDFSGTTSWETVSSDGESVDDEKIKTCLVENKDEVANLYLGGLAQAQRIPRADLGDASVLYVGGEATAYY